MNTLIYWTYPEGKRKPVLKMTRLIKKLGRLMPLLLLWRRSKSATCPSNVTSSTSASTQLDTFSGSSSASTYNVEVGPVSSALYFMYYLPYSTAFVKLNSDGTKVWSKSVNFLTLVRSFCCWQHWEQRLLYQEVKCPNDSWEIENVRRNFDWCSKSVSRLQITI